MLSQSQIDQRLSQIKAWYELHYPLCGFCSHLVKDGTGDLAHFIRRSDSRDLQTVKLNTCLAHRTCHTSYDDYPDKRIYLPRIVEVSYILWLLNKEYFNRFSADLSELTGIFARFPEVGQERIAHHGELLQLNYLYL